MPANNFPSISSWIAKTPIAHRGLHDKAQGRFENTLSAASAAVSNGFNIEVDLHPSADGVPMVFHDLTLDRLTPEKGNMRERKAAELAKIKVGGSQDHIPSLRQLLATISGKVGLVIELKGLAGEDDGFVEAVAKELEHYDGQAAIMSFNHWLVADARRQFPSRAVGLTAEGDDRYHDMHMGIAQSAAVDFVSYGIKDLPCRFGEAFRKSGKPLISWTIRTPDLAAKSALHADQITFEGFDPRDP